MEHPQYRNPADFNQSPLEAEGGPLPRRRPEVSMAAGQILTPRAGGERTPVDPQQAHGTRAAEQVIAAAMQNAGEAPPAPQPEAQHSSWHTIRMENGKAASLEEQHYGDEYYAQASVEQNATPQHTHAMPSPQQLPVHNPTTPTPTSTPQPSYMHQSTYHPAVQPASTLSATPQKSSSPSQSYGHPAITDGLNPTTPQLLQSPAEPMLPPGQPTHVDSQHLLPPPSKLKLFLQNPWLWLAVGVLMIIYFATA